MKHQVSYRSNWAMPMALLIIFTMVGCTGQLNPPTLPPETSPTAEASLPTSDAASSPTPPSVEAPATAQPVADQNVLYQDDFTNPATNWAVAKFGNLFIGYHEPESYHIEIQSPHLTAPVVSIPDPAAHNYPDATIELAVQTVSGKTATEGE